MNMKSIALKKQLEIPELQSINPIIVGELKAVEMLMEEFAQLFELYEVEEITHMLLMKTGQLIHRDKKEKYHKDRFKMEEWKC